MAQNDKLSIELRRRSPVSRYKLPVRSDIHVRMPATLHYVSRNAPVSIAREAWALTVEIIDGMDTPLSLMLWMDSQYAHPSALPSCLGDGYLYALNPVFHSVRDAALAVGVTYRSCRDGELQDYNVAPLLVLPRILESGIVPYFDNADLLRQVVAARPAAKMMADEIRFAKSNYHMHESAHVIADRALQPLGLDGVVQSALGESFANTVEAIGWAYASQDLHRSMYSINSYIAMKEKGKLGLLRGLVDAFGVSSVFESALWIYFYLNAKPDSDCPGDKYQEFAASVIWRDSGQLSPSQRLLVHAAADLFDLSKGFRSGTTPLHFRLTGQEAQYTALKDLDFETADLNALGLASGVKALLSIPGVWTPAAN